MSEMIYLDTDEAAVLVRLSRTTMERMRVQGTGPQFMKAGSGLRAKVLYRRKDLIEWLEAKFFQSTAEYNLR